MQGTGCHPGAFVEQGFTVSESTLTEPDDRGKAPRHEFGRVQRKDVAESLMQFRLEQRTARSVRIRLPAPGGLWWDLPLEASRGDRSAICSVQRCYDLPGGAWATRKPRLLFRLDGSFLLRFAERQFLASLFQLPPRYTRFTPYDRSPGAFLTPAGGIANWKRPPPG